jgi:hypothetical protein
MASSLRSPATVSFGLRRSVSNYLFETAATNGLNWNTTIQAVGSLDVFEMATLFVASEGLRPFSD